jgi:hypothetical protein
VSEGAAKLREKFALNLCADHGSTEAADFELSIETVHKTYAVRQWYLTFFCLRTIRCNFSSTFYLQSWCIIQVVYSLCQK